MLYYDDPYLRETDAVIMEIKGNEILLDKTIFYPGGGGQPFDTGTIENDFFKTAVLETRKEDGKIWHRVEKNNFKVGEKVRIKIDWDRRYYFMKAHTGEHILYRSIENVSRVNFEKMVLDHESTLFVSGEISLDDISHAEDIANSIIRMNIPVKIYYENIENVSNTRIKRDRIREENVRIVEIENFDRSACAGIHVKQTGEIGKIVVTRVKKGKFTEIKFIVSEKAEKFQDEIFKKARRVYSEFSLNPENFDKIIEIKKDYENVKENYYNLTLKYFKFNSIEINGIKVNYSIDDPGDFLAKERIAHGIIENHGNMVIIGNITRSIVEILVSDDLLKIMEILKNFLNERNLKGGGKNNFLMINGDVGEIFNGILEKIKTISPSTL